MKNRNYIIGLFLIAGILGQSCTKEFTKIEGTGNITTKTLQIDDFSSIDIQGVDNVEVAYGTEQKVTVTGHANIIERIETEVFNDTWNIKLKNGNYGMYDLTYYLTLPSIENIENNGTGDVLIADSFSQDKLSVSLIGTGSFFGYRMHIKNCNVDISGTGDCEVSVESKLDVDIAGSGNVYYKGTPSVSTRIEGSGSVIQKND